MHPEASEPARKTQSKPDRLRQFLLGFYGTSGLIAGIIALVTIFPPESFGLALFPLLSKTSTFLLLAFSKGILWGGFFICLALLALLLLKAPFSAIGFLVAFPAALLFATDIAPIGNGFAERFRTDREVAAAHKTPWFAHESLAPSVPITRLVMRGNGCDEACLSRILHTTDLHSIGTVYRKGSDQWPSIDNLSRLKEQNTRCIEQYALSRSPGICAKKVVDYHEILPFVLVEFWQDRRAALNPSTGIGGDGSRSAVMTEFTAIHPQGRLLGRWEYGYYANERDMAYTSPPQTIVHWRVTEPHGTPFELQDVLTALLGPTP